MAVLWEFDCQKIQQRNTSSSYLEKQNPRLDIFCFVFQNVVCFIWQKNHPGKADKNGFTPSGSHGISDGTETNLRTILLPNSLECQNTCYAISKALGTISPI